MAAMTPPRFGLRTLLIAVLVLSTPIAWIAYQLNWLRQRDAFQRDYVHGTRLLEGSQKPTPWSLRPFVNGSHSVEFLIEESQVETGQKLFPEAVFTSSEAIFNRPFPDDGK
jgi:hypothetical protein